MSSSVWTVTTLIRFIKKRLEAESSIQSVSVQGEISNFVAHRSGHWYFTLKDAQSRCSCVMFARAASSVSNQPKDGDQVVVVGSISVFEGSGSMQLYVSHMMPTGLGALYIELERIKKRCEEKGWFDSSHKKKLPSFPERIGVITSVKTAAFYDVESTLKRRWPLAHLIHFPVAVQGEGSVAQLIEAVKQADQSSLDAILMVRGGGSIEDLWSFNSEALVEAIFLAKTPIVSGVGHQSDVTLVDFVSDVRAPTPTGAAEIATPNQVDIQQQLSKLQQQMSYRLRMTLANYQLQLDQLTSAQVFADSKGLTFRKRLMLSQYRQVMFHKMSQLKQQFQLLRSLNHRFQVTSSKIITTHQGRLQKTEGRLLHSMQSISQKTKHNLLLNQRLLISLSPNEILKRGYVLTYQKHQLITRLSDIDEAHPLRLQYHDGIAIAASIVKGENHGKNDI